MNSPSKNVCRFILGAVFLLAGGMKIMHPADFFSDLLSFRVPFPESFCVSSPCFCRGSKC